MLLAFGVPIAFEEAGAFTVRKLTNKLKVGATPQNVCQLIMSIMNIGAGFYFSIIVSISFMSFTA